MPGEVGHLIDPISSGLSHIYPISSYLAGDIAHCSVAWKDLHSLDVLSVETMNLSNHSVLKM